ncbi:MAG: hypothetical protein U0133_10900 [Gemmatimonadales bacterium]
MMDWATGGVVRPARGVGARNRLEIPGASTGSSRVTAEAAASSPAVVGAPIARLVHHARGGRLRIEVALATCRTCAAVVPARISNSRSSSW